MPEQKEWLPDLVAQTVGQWSLNSVRRVAPFLDEHDADFARQVGKALIQAALRGPRRTAADRKKTDYAFFTGLSPFYYLTEPEDARYLRSLLEQEGVKGDTGRVFRALDVLLRAPEAREAALRSMLDLDLERSDLASRDYVLLAVLEGDEGYRVSDAFRRALGERIVGGDVASGTKALAQRLRLFAEAALA